MRHPSGHAVPGAEPTIHIEPRVLRPWVRLIARVIDILLAALLLGWVAVYLHPSWMVGSPLALIFFYGALFLIPLEALLISRWCSTPGKAILNVKLQGVSDRRMPLRAALTRSIWVWVGGLTFGVPFLLLSAGATPIVVFLAGAPALAIGYWQLTRSGSTWWDRRVGITVVHGRLGRWRIGIAAGLLLFGAISAVRIQVAAGNEAEKPWVEIEAARSRAHYEAMRRQYGIP